MAVDKRRQFAGQAPWENRGPDVVVADERVRVIVTSRWADGHVAEVEGWALAWTPRAWEVLIPHPDDLQGSYRLWVPDADVRRAGD